MLRVAYYVRKHRSLAFAKRAGICSFVKLLCNQPTSNSKLRSFVSQHQLLIAH